MRVLKPQHRSGRERTLNPERHIQPRCLVSLFHNQNSTAVPRRKNSNRLVASHGALFRDILKLSSKSVNPSA
eukprot:5153541-Amphidinium_carterae.1